MQIQTRMALIVAIVLTFAGCSGKRSFDTGGLFPIISKDRKWGYIDKTGKMIIQPQFEDIRFFSEGLACVTVDGKKYGYIDKTGSFVITPQYDAALSFSNGRAAVQIDN